MASSDSAQAQCATVFIFVFTQLLLLFFFFISQCNALISKVCCVQPPAVAVAHCPLIVNRKQAIILGS